MSHQSLIRACCCLGIVMLAGCVVHEPKHAHVQDAIEHALNAGIHGDAGTHQRGAHTQAVSRSALNNMLLPNVSVSLPNLKEPEEHRFDIRAVNLPANAYFTSLVKNTTENILVDPDVKGSISLVLKNVTVLEGIQAACSAYGFQYEETAYGYHIEAKKLITKIYTVNYLDVARNGTSKTRITPSSISDRVGSSSAGTGTTSGSTTGSASTTTSGDSSEIKTTINNDFWTELKNSLVSMIGDKDGHTVIVNPTSGLVVIRAYPDELRSVSTYLRSMQNIMARQVILEAKVLEVHLKAKYQAGIQWKLFGLNLDGTQTIPGEIDNPSKIFTLNINNKSNFANVINLLNTQGRTEVLSSPRIATMNNQKAIIKVGDDQFFITNVSSTTTGAVTGAVTQDVQLTPFFSGIALDVTPEITQDGSVTLHIHPIVSEVVTDAKSFELGSQVTKNLPLAKSSVRESDSVVRARNGEVIIIGGLMENQTKSFDGSVPGLDQTSIKASFGRHDKMANKIELVILLKPIIVKHNTWAPQLSDAKREFQAMREPYTYTVHTHE